MKRNRVFIIIILCLVFIQCRFGSRDPNDKESIETDFRRGPNLNPKEWACNQIDGDLVCIPSAWQPIQQSNVFFFASLEKNEYKYSFFTVAKYNMQSTNLEAENYLKEGYAQLLADTTEKFTGYTLKKITFEDKVAYYAEYFANVNNEGYLAYSMVFEQDGFLYDVLLKFKKKESFRYKDTFKNILFNFKVGGKAVFDEYDKIEKIDTVDLSKL